jgi:hypothetical protein
MLLWLSTCPRARWLKSYPSQNHQERNLDPRMSPSFHCLVVLALFSLASSTIVQDPPVFSATTWWYSSLCLLCSRALIAAAGEFFALQSLPPR